MRIKEFFGANEIMVTVNEADAYERLKQLQTWRVILPLSLNLFLHLITSSKESSYLNWKRKRERVLTAISTILDY